MASGLQPGLYRVVVERVRLGAVLVGAAQGRLVHHPHPLERRRRLQPAVEDLHQPGVELGGQDRVEEVLLRIGEGVAGGGRLEVASEEIPIGHPGGERGALDVELGLQRVHPLQDPLSRAAAEHHQAGRHVRQVIGNARPQDLPPMLWEVTVLVVLEGHDSALRSALINSTSGRVTMMSVSIRTIASAPWRSGATVFKRHGGTSCGPGTIVASAVKRSS